jgi:hypothetical protein
LHPVTADALLMKRKAIGTVLLLSAGFREHRIFNECQPKIATISDAMRRKELFFATDTGGEAPPVRT